MCKVCFVDFTNDYRPIIKLLTQRGNAIKEGKSVEVRKLNQKLLEFKRNKELLEKHRRPLSCFVTFMYPDGKKLAEQYVRGFDDQDDAPKFFGECI